MADYDKPPPSYDEAINDNYGGSFSSTSVNSAPSPSQPQRPSAQPPIPQRPASYTPPTPARPTSSVPTPARPARPPPSPSSGPSRTSNSNQQDSLNDLYTANEHLPFRYPKGYFCKKCKNSGYKTKYTKYCSTCWDKFYLNDHAYNPNPKLPFRYPKRYFCDKCHNTGSKIKNGKTCKDCYERFAPRNLGLSRLSSPSMFDDLFGSTTTTTTYINNSPPMGAPPMGAPPMGAPPMGAPPMGPPPMGPPPMGPPPMGYMPPPGTYYMPQQTFQSGPVRVRPGDPRIGGTLCGRCRGSGKVHFLLDEELCPVCSGLGRILR